MWHYHPEFELTFTRGARGTRYLGRDVRQFDTLDLVLVAPNQAHTWHSRTGSDSMVGGAGDDIYVVDATTDRVVEAAAEGDDLVLASVNYTLTAEVERLTLVGGAHSGTGNALNNVITGNGNDTLDGAAGADTLIGGAGNDLQVGSLGDVIVEDAVGGIDTVMVVIPCIAAWDRTSCHARP